jgi:predicted lipoprotein with Yx(FWY)xxD motif
MLKRKPVALLVAMLATLALPATAPSSTSHRGTTVKARNTDKGMLLVSRTGHVLYVFARDSKNKNVCVTLRNGCSHVWPAVTTKVKPVAKSGVKRKMLGTIKLPDGSTQVTYNGHALYFFQSDNGGGDTSYVGINSTGGKWYAINVNGKVVK